MTEHWKKSVLLREYGDHFFEAFSESVCDIKERNNAVIDRAKRAERVTFFDSSGNKLTGFFDKDQKWANLHGAGHYDLMPGEVATRINNLNGHLKFGGTFLSTIPFAIKYGVIDNILDIEIKDSKVVGVSSSNDSLKKDFISYLNRCEGNKIVEEFGIGTNTGIRKLYGRNASFEERHAGLHLGLGGGQKQSHHLDLIFSNGTLMFDEEIIIKNGVFYV